MIVKELCEEFHVSQRRALRRWTWPGSAFAMPVVRDEQVLARRIEELAGARPRFGYRRIWALLDREGWTVNKKAVASSLLRSGVESGPTAGQSQSLRGRAHGQDEERLPPPALRGNVRRTGHWDFIFDRTSDGRSLKWLSIVDEYTSRMLGLGAAGV